MRLHFTTTALLLSLALVCASRGISCERGYCDGYNIGQSGMCSHGPITSEEQCNSAAGAANPGFNGRRVQV
jgi:hypothetical protein